MRSWYEIRAKKDSADLYIYDEIGMWGITANDLVSELRGLSGKALNVYINSPGGNVFDGIAIYNALNRHEGAVNVTVDALAASIASVIAQAGKTRTMAKSSTMMIHEPVGLAFGDNSMMEKMAAELNLLGDQIAGIYADRAGGTAEEWRAKMADETWYNAADAVAAGLADREAAAPQNAYAGRIFNLSKFSKVPEWVNQAKEPAEPVQTGSEEGQEDDMDELLAIRQALGLDEDGDILATIAGLKGEIVTLNKTLQSEAPDKGETAQLRAELSAANQRIISLDNEHNTETLALRQKVHLMEATHRVDQAIATGRVTPANRDIALKVALGQTEEEFNRFVGTLPKVDLGEHGHAGNFENEQYEPTEADIAVARQMGTWNDADPAGSRLALMKAKGAKIPAAKA